VAQEIRSRQRLEGAGELERVDVSVKELDEFQPTIGRRRVLIKLDTGRTSPRDLFRRVVLWRGI
jgi:hypothetical protein